LSRFSAKIITESLLEFDEGSGNGIGSSGDVKTNTENAIAPIIATI
jgi:hypothetical protein